MATKTARLIINLQDGVTQPAGAVARALDKVRAAAARPFHLGAFDLAKRLQGEAVKIQAAAGRVAGALSPASFGLGALIHQTQEYEKAVYGVKVAAIADNMDSKIEAGHKRNVINLDAVRNSAVEAKKEVEDLSRAMMMRPTALMKAWEAVGKAGVPYSLDGLSPEEKQRRLLKSQKNLVEMGGEIHRQDTEMPIDKAAEFLHTLGINFKAGKADFERGSGKGDYDDDVAKIANQLLFVANATKTSASKLSAGLRQFAPLYGNLGNSFAESAALLGAAVQGGLDEIESGTALKSMGVRFIKNFTSEGRDAWLAAGLNRSDFTKEVAVSGKKAAATLKGLTDKKLSKDQLKAIDARFLEGERQGKLSDPKWQQETLRRYNAMTGARDQQTRDRNADRVRMAMFSSGNEIDMFKLFRALSLKLGKMSGQDQEKSLEHWGMGELGTQAQGIVGEKLKAGTLSQAQMAVIGEGRHLSRYNAILALFGTAEQLAERAKSMSNKEMTTAGRDLAKDDPFWKWEQAMSRLEQAFNRLRESEAITGLINKFAELATRLAEADPRLVEIVGQLTVLAFIGAPVAAAVAMISGALIGLISLGGMASRMLLGGAAAAPAAAAVAGGTAGAVATAGGAAAATAAAVSRRAHLFKYLRAGGMIGGGMLAGQAIGDRLGMGGGGEVGGAVAGGAAAYGLMRYASWRTARMAAGGARFVPGIGWVIAGGLGAYGAYQGYKTGGVWGAVKGAVGLDTSGAAKADTPSPASTIANAGNHVAAGTSVPSVAAGEVDGVAAAAGRAHQAVEQAMMRVRQIVAQTDLHSEGVRMMDSLAAGIRDGASGVEAAASAAAGSRVRRAVQGSFGDGAYQ